MTTNSIAIIRLNVGGQHFITTRATLCAVEGSLLACMFCLDSNFAPPIENEGKEVFLDRNPIAFGSILDYLRDGCRVMVDLPSNNNEEALLQRLRTDADYFGLDGLVLYCDTKLRIIIEKQCDQRDNAANAAKLIKKQCNELDNAAKLVNYLYVQNSDGKCPGPGWRLYKYNPSIHDGGRYRRENGTFTFERTTYTTLTK